MGDDVKGLKFGFVFAVLCFVVLVLGCGPRIDPGVVGGECRDDRDCAEECLGGKDFPGGMCSVSCRDDRDCPRNAWCVDKKGGVCLLSCRYDEDWRPGYKCKSEDREGAAGETPVCID